MTANGAEDVIGTLTRRVRELSGGVARLEGELASALKRIAVYEEYDEAIQGALTAALRAAYDIRQQAESSSSELIDDARSQRTMLQAEIDRLEQERALLGERLADARRSTIAVAGQRRVGEPDAEHPSMPMTAATVRAVVEEVMRGLQTTAPFPAEAVPPPARSVELRLAPAPTLARLSSLERGIERLPSVRRVAFRELRDGAAILAVSLRPGAAPRELADAVGRLAEVGTVVAAPDGLVIEARLEALTTSA